MNTPTVSVVSGTLNRLPLLKKMVWSLREGGLENLPYQIVLVDGGSKDGTEDWCRMQPDVTFIQQGMALGAIKAFNAGFAAALGKYVVNLNDDVEVMPWVISAAVAMLEKDKRIGQVAIPFSDPDNKVHLDYCPMPDRQRRLYSNFGVTRRWLGDKLGWWGDYAHTYAGDTHLSTAIWHAGYTVEPLDMRLYVWHEIVQDSTRCPNTETHMWYEYWAKNWQGIPAMPRIREGE